MTDDLSCLHIKIEITQAQVKCKSCQSFLPPSIRTMTVPLSSGSEKSVRFDAVPFLQFIV